MAPVDGRQLPDDGLTLALDDEQLRLLLVADDVQSGRDSAVQDPVQKNRLVTPGNTKGGSITVP